MVVDLVKVQCSGDGEVEGEGAGRWELSRVLTAIILRGEATDFTE